jgi:hypothetical protein
LVIDTVEYLTRESEPTVLGIDDYIEQSDRGAMDEYLTSENEPTVLESSQKVVLQMTIESEPTVLTSS